MAKIVEQFVLQHVIYSGPHCDAYRATHLQTDKEYAIKAFRYKDFIGSQALQDCIINEVQNLKKLDHEHIVKFHKMLKTNNNIYLVYEYCPEGTLHRRLEDRPLSD
jgi:serine/threonine protein kinase